MPVIALVALVGLAAGLWVPAPSLPVGCVMLFVLGTLGPAVGARWLALGCLSSWLGLHTSVTWRDAQVADVLEQQDIVVQGRVIDFPRATPRGAVFLFRVTNAGALRGRLLRLRTYAPEPPPVAGHDYQYKVKLRQPRAWVNPGSLSRAIGLFAQSVHALGYVRPSLLNRRLSSRCMDGLLCTRARLLDRVGQVASDTPGFRLYAGLTLGIRHLMRPSDWDTLRATGTTHLFVISGLHIGMVAAVAWFIVRTFLALIARATGIYVRSAGIVAALLGAGVYTALAGLSLPTLRALGMLALTTVVALSGRRATAAGVLGALALAVSLANPLALLRAGFWLSFLAVAALLAVSASGAQYTSPIRRAFGQAWRAQLAISIGLCGPLLLFYGDWPLIAPFINLLVIPVFAVVLVPLSLVGLLVVVCNVAAGSPVIRLAAAILDELLVGLEQLALSLPATLSLVISTSSDALRMSVLDTGQGLAVVAESDGHALLYDTGPAWEGGDAGAQVVVPFLRARGIAHLDTLVLSHGDTDHAGGLRSVLDGVSVSRLVGPPQQTGIRETCELGQRWSLGRAIVEVIHPRTFAGWSDNNASCALRITVGQAVVVLPGDIEADAEAVLQSRGDLYPADLVVAPHHGSRTSSSMHFVETLRPRYVVYTVGYKNRWGFPADGVRKRWDSVGSCELRTDRDGAVEFALDTQGRLTFASAAARSWRLPWALRRSGSNLCEPEGFLWNWSG